MPAVRTRRLVSSAAAFLALGSAEARAEDADEVVVMGSAPSAGFVSKASVDDAPREITDASSLIESVPGVHVRRTGGDDSFATLSIRGSTSSEVAVLFAGVPMTGAADPSLDLSTLPLWPGARIKVYRSFAPAALGAGSLGGTLVLEPPRTSDPERTEAWAAVGSFGEARLRVADVRAIGDGGARVVTALSASRADDDFTFYDYINDTFTTRNNNGHADVNGLVSVALPAGSGGTLTVTTLLQAREQGLAGPIGSPTPFASQSSNRELASLDLTQAAGQGAWSVRGWARRDELRVSDKPGNPEDMLPTRSDDVIDAVGLSGGWRGNVARGLVIETRADASAEGNEPGFDVGAVFVTPEATRLSLGAGVDADWRATAAWKLGASGRVDADTDHVAEAEPSAGPQVRPTGHVGTEVQVGPAVLSAHGGAIARPPSFVELYGSPGGIIPNTTLVGESAWTVDAGGRIASPRGPVHAQAELVGFATWARDLIVFEPKGYLQLLQAENIGTARLYGVEASAGAWGYGFDVRFAYTGLVTFDDSIAGSPPLPLRPANDLVADAGYSLGPLRVRYGVDAVTGTYYDDHASILVPPRVLQSTGARLDVPGVRGLRVGLEIRNLFDVRTAVYPGFSGPQALPIGDQYNYPLPGRSFLVTARWTSSPTPELSPVRDR
jgi:vitamin B12 transporter